MRVLACELGQVLVYAQKPAVLTTIKHPACITLFSNAMCSCLNSTRNVCPLFPSHLCMKHKIPATYSPFYLNFDCGTGASGPVLAAGDQQGEQHPGGPGDAAPAGKGGALTQSPLSSTCFSWTTTVASSPSRASPHKLSQLAACSSGQRVLKGHWVRAGGAGVCGAAGRGRGADGRIRAAVCL